MNEEDAALWTKESSTQSYQIAIDEFARLDYNNGGKLFTGGDTNVDHGNRA